MNKTFLPEYLPLWDIQEVRTFRGGRPKAYESVLGEIVVIAQAYVRFLKFPSSYCCFPSLSQVSYSSCTGSAK